MSKQRIQPVDPADAVGQMKRVFDSMKKATGRVPEMIRTMAAAPSVLNGYLAFSRSVASGVLRAETRELIALAVSNANRCTPCLIAHAQLAALVGLSEAEIAAAALGKSDDPKTNAILSIALAIVRQQGHLSDAQIEAGSRNGVTGEELAEIVANVGLVTFTNYFNSVAALEPEVHLPHAA